MLTNTVDSILTDFRKKVTQLKKLSDGHRNKAADIAVQAAKLSDQSNALLDEASRAESVAQRISALID